MVELHGLWRWVVLISVVVTVVKGLIGWMQSSEWSRIDRSLLTTSITAIDIQVLLGFLVYGMNRWWQGNSTFIKYIHPLIMIVALALAHVVSSRVKKASEPTRKFQVMAVGLFIVLVVIVLGIPRYAWSSF